MSKWYGKIMFREEGIYTYSESDSEAEVRAFVNGFNSAKEITNEDETDGLEDYWTVVDQNKPVDE